MCPTTEKKFDQGWFEEHRSEFKVLTWRPDSPDVNPSEHLCDVQDK